MKVVVIANNFLSDITNNGKTIKFLLSKYEEDDIFWIYSTPLETDLKCRVKKVLVSPFSFSLGFDDLVEKNVNNSKKVNTKSILRRFLKVPHRHSLSFQILKFVREFLFWLKIKPLRKCIYLECNKENIEKVIFVAGDFAMLHKLAVKVSSDLSVPLQVYVTDDYIFEYSPRSVASFRKGIHNKIVRREFQRTFSESSFNNFVSEKMKDLYNFKFNVDGKLSFNSSRVLRGKYDLKHDWSTASRIFKIRYFGSLHSGRSSALREFLSLVREFNNSGQKKIVIEIYCADDLPVEILGSNLQDLITRHKPVNGECLEQSIQGADALVVLESSKPQDLRNTWLSFSTKVMEYLQSGKPIVAFGPTDNPSIGELVSSGSAIYINKSEHFEKLFHKEIILEMLCNSNSLFRYLEDKNTLF